MIKENVGSEKNLVHLTSINEAFNFGEAQDTSGIEDGVQTKIQFSNFLMIELAGMILNLIGLVFSIFAYDLIYLDYSDDYYQIVVAFLLWSLLISTIILLLITYMRYHAKLEWMKLRKQISQSENIITVGLLPEFIFECFIYILIPTPFYQDIYIHMDTYFYALNELFCLLAIFRIIFIFRSILTNSKYYSNRTQRVCNLYASEANYIFVIKSLMRTQPYTVIFTGILIAILGFGHALRICESPLQRNDPEATDFRNYWNSMWNIIVTMATLGYGDYFPKTFLGRLVIVMVCIIGLSIVSIMVVTLTNSLETSLLENKAITVIERVKLKAQMKREAGEILTIMARIALNKRHKKLNSEQFYNYKVKLQKKLKDFKKTQRLYRETQDTTSFNEQMNSEFLKLKEHFWEIYEKQKMLIEGNLEILENLQMPEQELKKYQQKMKQ